jgi:hypothetical protein
MGGEEFARRRYIMKRAGELLEASWDRPCVDTLRNFLNNLRHLIKRHKTPWGNYFNVRHFEKEWQKRLKTLSRVRKRAKDS